MKRFDFLLCNAVYFIYKKIFDSKYSYTITKIYCC